MSDFYPIIVILIFPSGLSLLLFGLGYSWVNRKILARFQGRMGPPFYQPLADLIKLLSKEELPISGTDPFLYRLLPIIALAGALTAGLYIPLFGLPSAFSFTGDYIVLLYLISLYPFALGLVGLLVRSRVASFGATRVMSQVFAYEVPFFLALLAPAYLASSWQLSEILTIQTEQWLIIHQPIGFLVALLSLMGKLELPPFDAPEAETEIVAGALTEYTGRGLAIFKLAKSVILVLGLSLISAIYLGGTHSLIGFTVKTLFLLLVVTNIEALFTRLRIDQSINLWWRWGILLALFQWLLMLGGGLIL